MRNISIVRSGPTCDLAEEREHLAAGQLFDHLAVADLHDPLEVAAHLENAFEFAAFHHRALDRGEATVGEHADDQVVEHVGLGLDRSAAVVFAHQRDDPVGDLGEQLAASERVERGIVVSRPDRPGVAHYRLYGASPVCSAAHWCWRVRFAESRPNYGRPLKPVGR